MLELSNIIAAGVARFESTLPDFARGPQVETEPPQPNITLSPDAQRALCLSCELAECEDITSPRCPIRIEQRRLWRNRR